MYAKHAVDQHMMDSGWERRGIDPIGALAEIISIGLDGFPTCCASFLREMLAVCIVEAGCYLCQ